MKNSFTKVFSYIIIAAFLAYWIAIIILSMPPNPLKSMVAGAAPRFRDIFGSSWNLFAPPSTYNNRLYYIFRDVNGTKRDTIEILAGLSKQKQLRAPFNQEENMMDHLLQNSLIGITTTIWGNKNLQLSDSTARIYINSAIAAVQNNRNFNRYLTTLNNYGKLLFKEKGKDTAAKEVKIVITQKMIRPFKEMANPDFVQKETLVFETEYMPCNR